MATDYYVTLTSKDGSTTKVKIIDSILSDTWEGDATALGIKEGKVASWGMKDAVLHTGPGIAGQVTLDGFSKKTVLEDSGTGSKANLMGSFPDGDLAWSCDKVD